MSKPTLATVTKITSTIRTVRGQKVLLDSDLSKIYGVETGALNRAVLRNLKRFPADFMFQLTQEEFENLKSQIGTSSSHGGRRKLPFAFTENGAVMSANVLNSPAAVRMSVFVVRAFVKMRELLGGTKELARQLADLERKLTGRIDVHEGAIVEVLQRMMAILDPPPPSPEPPKRQIGFHVEPEEKPKIKRKKKK
ncbi:MAG: ORF6N domain-containing protein [Verrucomicrobiota bacterium]